MWRLLFFSLGLSWWRWC